MAKAFVTCLATVGNSGVSWGCCPDQHGEDHLKDKADRHHPWWLVVGSYEWSALISSIRPGLEKLLGFPKS